MKNSLNLNMKGNHTLTEIFEWLICIIVAIVLALIVRYFIVTPTIVKMTSMFPTLKPNERLILNRTIRINNYIPTRGDIITFEAPTLKTLGSQIENPNENPKAIYENEPSNIFSKFTYYVLEIGKQSYIKRVIGLPGEHIEIKNGKVYINGEELQEDYLQEGVITKLEQYAVLDDFIVPDGYVFAMGDNRIASTDCRDFGCVPISKIESIVLFRFWPLNKFRKNMISR